MPTAWAPPGKTIPSGPNHSPAPTTWAAASIANPVASRSHGTGRTGRWAAIAPTTANVVSAGAPAASHSPTVPAGAARYATTRATPSAAQPAGAITLRFTTADIGTPRRLL